MFSGVYNVKCQLSVTISFKVIWMFSSVYNVRCQCPLAVIFKVMWMFSSVYNVKYQFSLIVCLNLSNGPVSGVVGGCGSASLSPGGDCCRG